jgi:CRISPR-associated protein Cmr6
MLEIMTPHQSSYYQNGEQPHESGQPNPIFFLTVPPGSGFTFHVTCDVERLRVLAPDLAENGHWQTLLTGTFEHAFTWLGFGAKTAVGYGAMEREKMSAQESEIEMSGEHSEPSPSQESMSPEEREIETLRSRFEADKAAGGPEPQGELASLRVELLRNAQQWESTELRRQAAELIEETERWLSWPKKKRDERRRMLQALRADRNEE